jgi:hypothetical protein
VEDASRIGFDGERLCAGYSGTGSVCCVPRECRPLCRKWGNFKHQSNACQGSTDKASKCVGSQNTYH